MTCDLVRPCARCTKRGIGHLCHDEPREPDSTTKKAAAAAKSQHHSSSNATADEGGTPSDQLQKSLDSSLHNSFEPGQDQVQENKLSLGAPAISRGVPLQLAQPTPVSGIQSNALSSSNGNQCMAHLCFLFMPLTTSYILSPFAFLCLRDYSEILGTVLILFRSSYWVFE